MSNLISEEQKLVDFNGAQLMAIKCNDGKIRVGVKWVCLGIGLSDGQYQNQTRKINEDIVLSRGIAKMQLPTTSGTQEVLCIELDFLPLWLAKINANIIEDSKVQERLISYQLKAKKVLAAAFIEKKPTSIEDVLIASLQSMKEIKLKQAQHDEDIKLLKAKSETRSEDFFTISGYASLRGFRVDSSKANLLGRKASQISRDYCVEMGKVTDPRFGQVNTYHLDVLKEVFK